MPPIARCSRSASVGKRWSIAGTTSFTSEAFDNLRSVGPMFGVHGVEHHDQHRPHVMCGPGGSRSPDRCDVLPLGFVGAVPVQQVEHGITTSGGAVIAGREVDPESLLAELWLMRCPATDLHVVHHISRDLRAGAHRRRHRRSHRAGTRWSPSGTTTRQDLDHHAQEIATRQCARCGRRVFPIASTIHLSGDQRGPPRVRAVRESACGEHHPVALFAEQIGGGSKAMPS